MERTKGEELRWALAHFVREEPRRIDSFLPEDIEPFARGVEAFHFEDEMIRYLQSHPNATTQEFGRFFDDNTPPLPPGDDGADLLEEYDDE